MAETQRLHILVLNQISANGLKRLPAETLCGRQGHGRARRGAGALGRHARAWTSRPACRRSAAPAPAPTTSRCRAMSARGVPVFNAPGANANAVKELVLAGMLMAARNLPRRCASWPRSTRRWPTWTRRSRTARRPSPATSWPARRWASSAWARSAAWWPTPRSSSACRCSATTRRSRSTRPGACRRRSSARPAWPRCCAAATSSPCTCRWWRPRATWSTPTTSARCAPARCC